MSYTTYKRRKEQGLCPICGNERDDLGYIVCSTCRKKQSVQRAETRRWLISIGICPKCGKNKLYGQERICPECGAKEYTRLQKCDKKKHKEQTHKYYIEKTKPLKEAGICMKCRKRKAVEGKTCCAICAEKNRKRAEEYRHKKKGEYISKSERPSYGLCYICGKKLDSEKRLCQSCAEKAEKRLPLDVNRDAWRNSNESLFK